MDHQYITLIPPRNIVVTQKITWTIANTKMKMCSWCNASIDNTETFPWSRDRENTSDITINQLNISSINSIYIYIQMFVWCGRILPFLSISIIFHSFYYLDTYPCIFYTYSLIFTWSKSQFSHTSIVWLCLIMCTRSDNPNLICTCI